MAFPVLYVAARSIKEIVLKIITMPQVIREGNILAIEDILGGILITLCHVDLEIMAGIEVIEAIEISLEGLSITRIIMVEVVMMICLRVQIVRISTVSVSNKATIIMNVSHLA